MSWMTDGTMLYMIGGLLPLLYVALLALRNGLPELASLRFCGVLIMWIGYHLTPWIAYLTQEPWESFLLVDKYVDAALLFSSLCMAAYLAGYELVFSGRRNPSRIELGDREPANAEKAVLVLSVIVFLLFIYTVGGFAQAWDDPTPRGEGQFDVRDWIGRLKHSGVLAANVLGLVLAFLSSNLILERGHGGGIEKARVILVGAAGLLVASLGGFHRFSRRAGIVFIILAFVAMRRGDRRLVPLVVLSAMFGVFLGLVGYFGREFQPQGVGNFIGAAVRWDVSGVEAFGETAVGPNINLLNATDAWTKKMETMEYEAHGSDLGLVFLWNLHPFPSEILPVIPLGTDLSDVMGTWGSVGLTTPAFAELHFVFGHFGASFILLLGMIFGMFEKRSIEQPGIMSSLYVLLCVASLGIGLHSSMRAMTRLVIYALFFLFIQSVADAVRKSPVPRECAE